MENQELGPGFSLEQLSGRWILTEICYIWVLHSRISVEVKRARDSEMYDLSRLTTSRYTLGVSKAITVGRKLNLVWKLLRN